MKYLLHHLLQASAEANPDAVAAIMGDRNLTYSELERRANQLSHMLIQASVSRGDRVGLYLDKSLEAVVGIYGILKAGAAYVPLDPNAPVSRLGYMARDCAIRCLVSGVEKAGEWRSLREEGAPIANIIVLNDDGGDIRNDAVDGCPVTASDALDSQPDSVPSIGAIDLDLAYILYTSGSTGVPKGVMLSHLNALTFVNWAVAEFSVRAQDRLSSHAPLHFDLSVFDLFASAHSAASVALVPAQTSFFPIEINRFIRGHNITIWYSVPSILSMLVLRGGLQPGEWPSLRAVLFAGEVFPTKYLRELMRRLPAVAFYNLFGPTETNVCTAYKVPPLPDDQMEPISIGKAIADVDVFAVTEGGQRARPGEIGELFVRGTTVMRGYWGDSKRTARVLVPDPLNDSLGDLVYRTGDLVKEASDGNLVFLGRRDNQIKSRGFRIELGDIESTLYLHPGVFECAVAAVPDELVTNRIKAFVVVREGVSESDLIEFCAHRLPRYMIPEDFEMRASLPKTSTGKVDKRALVGGRT